MINYIGLEEAKSTNTYLLEHASSLPDRTVVYTWRQTAGRGQKGNSWESEPGMNLAFSLLLKQPPVEVRKQFCISEAVSVAICDFLSQFTGDFKVKWPNDIYWRDRKLCGILIENRLSGEFVRDSIIGVGLNVNQTQFLSDAPNPVSLCQITGHEHDREALLHNVAERFTLDVDAEEYRALLYRRHGFHAYRDADSDFEAELITVEDDGHLLLRDRNDRQRRYAFKEVQFTITNKQ